MKGRVYQQRIEHLTLQVLLKKQYFSSRKLQRYDRKSKQMIEAELPRIWQYIELKMLRDCLKSLLNRT